MLAGGEGATAREVLRHKSVEQVVMVDIDKVSLLHSYNSKGDNSRKHRRCGIVSSSHISRSGNSLGGMQKTVAGLALFCIRHKLCEGSVPWQHEHLARTR